jgi:hypothetical protein
MFLTLMNGGSGKGSPETSTECRAFCSEGGEALGVRRLDAAFHRNLIAIVSCKGGVEPPHSKALFERVLARTFLISSNDHCRKGSPETSILAA